MTTDPADLMLRKIIPEGPRKGQQEAYLVLSDAERARGFVRPVRQKYVHLKCGVVTRMGEAIAETYARNPKFYGGTFCVGCGAHFPLRDADGIPNFLWESDGEPVGSDAGEAAEWNEKKRRREAEKTTGAGI
jgi:hypothetical protein